MSDCNVVIIRVKNTNGDCSKVENPEGGARIKIVGEGEEVSEQLVLELPGLMLTTQMVKEAFDVNKYIPQKKPTARGFFYDFFLDMYVDDRFLEEGIIQEKLMSMDGFFRPVFGGKAYRDKTRQANVSGWVDSFSAENFLYAEAPFTWQERYNANPATTPNRQASKNLVQIAIRNALLPLEKSNMFMLQTSASNLNLNVVDDGHKKPKAENRYDPNLDPTQSIPKHQITNVVMDFRIPFTAKFNGTLSWTTVTNIKNAPNEPPDEKKHSVTNTPPETEPSIVGYLRVHMVVPCVHPAINAGADIDVYTRREKKQNADPNDPDPFVYHRILIPAFFHHYRAPFVEGENAQTRFMKSLTQRNLNFWGKTPIADRVVLQDDPDSWSYEGNLTMPELWENAFDVDAVMKPAEKRHGQPYADIGFFDYDNSGKWNISQSLLSELQRSLDDCTCAYKFTMTGGWEVQFHYAPTGTDNKGLRTGQIEYAQMNNLEFMIKESLETPTDWDASASTLVLTTPAVAWWQPQDGTFIRNAERYLVYNNVMKFRNE